MRSLCIFFLVIVLASCQQQHAPDKFVTADEFISCINNDDVAGAARLLGNTNGAQKCDTFGLSQHVHLLHSYFSRYGIPPRSQWKVFNDFRSPIVKFDCIEIPISNSFGSTTCNGYTSIILNFDHTQHSVPHHHIVNYDLRKSGQTSAGNSYTGK